MTAVCTPNRRAISVPEAAELLGVTERLLYRAAAKGEPILGVATFRIGGRVLLPREPFLAAYARVMAGNPFDATPEDVAALDQKEACDGVARRAA